jgi:hypothetical protein
MSSANDGVSRFSDSTIYGTATFVEPIVVPSIVYTTPAVGQVGYTYSVPYTNVTASFTTGVPIGYASSPVLPAGTYSMSVNGLTSRIGAVVTDRLIQVIPSAVGAAPIVYLQSGDSTNTDADTGVDSFLVSSLFKLTTPQSVAVFVEFEFSAGNIGATGQNFTYLITRLF